MDKNKNIPTRTKKPSVQPYRLPASPFKSPARSIGVLTAGMLAKTLGQRGFAGPEIIKLWPSIVGNSLAQISIPERLVWPHSKTTKHPSTPEHSQEGGTLHIRVDGPASIEIQHMSDQIISRINNYFGFMAVFRLHIIQAPIGWSDTYNRHKQRSSPIKSDLTTEEPSLEESLKRLAQAIHKQKTTTDPQSNSSKP